MINAFPQPSLLVGRSERILVANRSANRVFNRDITGLHYTAVLRQPQLVTALERAMNNGDCDDVRYRNPTIANDNIYRASFRPLESPVSVGVVVTLEDLSHEEGLGEMRRDFVANVSHELRSPLTAMTGFIETLRGPAANDAAARDTFLKMMETEAARMTRLVEDLLSLSRVESEARLKPDVTTDLIAVLNELRPVLSGLVDTKSVTLEFVLPEEPVLVTGDRDQLGQVFRNLLENAVKYGNRHVRLSVSLPEREAFVRGPAVVVDVEDDGDGIAPHHVPRLTERFYRVDTHRSRAEGGTGLGLAIVKHIIGRHRGRLRISSVPGEGSTFSVILPRL
ncbi:sensor histidine kinase [Shimia ponticola]|uniref:sensor histidine kinase n=1 Tax=Shimia ponticola TaxID=2582893 RepID=UPI0021040B66|nr:ATP-binding protein [Shimia ponticola]